MIYLVTEISSYFTPIFMLFICSHLLFICSHLLFMCSYLLFMCSYLLFMCSYLIYLYLSVLTNFMFACIYVIVGFNSFMQLMLFVICIYVPTLNKIYLLTYLHPFLINQVSKFTYFYYKGPSKDFTNTYLFIFMWFKRLKITRACVQILRKKNYFYHFCIGNYVKLKSIKYPYIDTQP